MVNDVRNALVDRLKGIQMHEEERIHEEEEADELFHDQESLSVSSFVTSMLNPISDAGVESIFTTASSSTITTASHPPIPPIPIPREVLQNLPTFDSVFRFNERLKSLEASFSEYRQTNPSAGSDRGAGDQPIVQISQHPEWFPLPKKPPTLDRNWNKTLPVVQGSTQTWISELAKQADSRSSFNELLDTPIDFSNFIMNRLGVDTLTHELLAGPTYELIRGSCNSLTELEYHLEEVYKATMNQLDWVNPEGQQYLHNLLQPLPLIPDNRGRRVIPFAHFINNDLEYLQGDLVPRTMWIKEPINYDKYAFWGVSYWGLKRQQFYGFAVNRESALDVYSKRRIIAVTSNFKRLRLQDIKDMPLLLVQGKLSNLTVEERFAFNVSLRMFTRSIVIQRRVEDLQLGVESYQKRLNLTKPDTYRSDLKRREAYTAYSNPRGFVYQNKDKKNRLMRIDELYKFSDGTLNDVRNALDDRLKGIRMQYLPQTIWRKGDKDRAAAMIQSIDKMLKTMRIMRSLERFVGGRLYEGDFQMLQRTI
nr:hypothetical protein [Tanacetum cinerariifolium]